MRQIADGVFEVAIGYVHAHLIVVDDGVVLADTGLPKRSAEIGRALHEMRRRIGDVHIVLLTHHHPDHVGGLGEVQRRSGARVVAHRLDVPVIDGSRGEVQGVRGIGGRCATSPPIRAETRSSRRFAGASRCGTVTRPYRSKSPRRGAGTPDSS
jgi:glyoxylase-like metal-dependent hydrolase (beta-lactamase superfamily II)